MSLINTRLDADVWARFLLPPDPNSCGDTSDPMLCARQAIGRRGAGESRKGCQVSFDLNLAGHQVLHVISAGFGRWSLGALDILRSSSPCLRIEHTCIPQQSHTEAPAARSSSLYKTFARSTGIKSPMPARHDRIGVVYRASLNLPRQPACDVRRGFTEPEASAFGHGFRPGSTQLGPCGSFKSHMPVCPATRGHLRPRRRLFLASVFTQVLLLWLIGTNGCCLEDIL